MIISVLVVPEADWKAIEGGTSPTVDDDSPKNEVATQQDRQFGVYASDPVAFIEFNYPENGSYSFNPCRLQPSASEVDEEGFAKSETLICSKGA